MAAGSDPYRKTWRIRAVDRSGIALDIAGRLDNGATVALVLRDISALGFRAMCMASALAPGAAISLDLPEIGAVRARIIWSGGLTLGGLFEEPLSWRKVQALLAAHRHVA